MFEKFFLSWVPMNIKKDWKAKLESAYAFMLKYPKITVCADNLDQQGNRIMPCPSGDFFVTPRRPNQSQLDHVLILC